MYPIRSLESRWAGIRDVARLLEQAFLQTKVHEHREDAEARRRTRIRPDDAASAR